MKDKDSQIAILGKELEKQKQIFLANMGRGTNPDGSDEYWEAKAKFDAADRKIKELDKELARLITGGTPLPPPEFRDKFPFAKKKATKRKVGKKGAATVKGPSGPHSSDGTQIQPSQSKVISGGDD